MDIRNLWIDACSGTKIASNRGLGMTGLNAGPEQIAHAIAMYEQARRMADPTEQLRARGVSRRSFDQLLRDLTAAPEYGDDRYRFSDHKRNPRTDAILGGFQGRLSADCRVWVLTVYRCCERKQHPCRGV